MTVSLRPFFRYYGGKWRAAPHYPAPKHDVIVEPFAGAAGYATRYHDHDIVLYEKDPKIAEMWRGLIDATRKDILDLPLLMEGQSVDDLNIPAWAQHLIGFWVNNGTTQPCKTMSAWGRQHPKQFWGEHIRQRIANQVEHISHWTIFNKDWIRGVEPEKEAPATWFIDPPYEQAGKYYKMGSQQIDFRHLGNICQRLPGQVIVCENEGAQWLPFRRFRDIQANPSKNGGKISKEVIYYQETKCARR